MAPLPRSLARSLSRPRPLSITANGPFPSVRGLFSLRLCCSVRGWIGISGTKGQADRSRPGPITPLLGLDRLRRRTRPLRSIAFDADDVVMTIGANFEDQQEDLAACLPHGPPGNPESSRTAAFNVA